MNDTIYVDRYFEDKELACPCGCGATVPDRAFDAITAFRRLYAMQSKRGKKVFVNSATRCAKYNATIKGSATESTHIPEHGGTAFDIRIEGGKNDIPLAYHLLWECGFRGIATINLAKGSIHADMEEPRTWGY